MAKPFQETFRDRTGSFAMRLVWLLLTPLCRAERPVLGDLGGGVSLLQSSKRLWAPAPPAASSLDTVLDTVANQTVNLSNAFDYTVIENITNASNETNQTLETVMIGSLKGAELIAVNATVLPRDCLMADWSDWSECIFNPHSGLKGAHQVRQRGILQPWLPGGEPCLSQLEGRECAVKHVP